MQRYVLAIFILANTLTQATAADAPWPPIDSKAAEASHEKACSACHIRMYGSDGSKMYTRDGRQLSNKLELLQRVASCSAMMNAGWFPDEEANVAGWLNERYYHFTQ